MMTWGGTAGREKTLLLRPDLLSLMGKGETSDSIDEDLMAY